MSSVTLRILRSLALALSSYALANGAEAGVFVSALSSFGRSPPVQTVQVGGSNCYYTDGWNGRGWYQCGDQWNDGFGWVGPFNLNTFGGGAVRRHHRNGLAVSHPRPPTPVYPRLEPLPRLGAGAGAPTVGLRAGGAPSFHPFGNGPSFHRFGAGGVRASPNFHAGAATVAPGLAGGGSLHQFHGAGVPRIGAPASPGFAGGGGFHGFGGAGNFRGAGVAAPHIGAPASPGFIGAGGLHGLGGATGVHIGAPPSPGFAVGGFHAGGVGAPHIGAFASPGFVGGGFHGVGGAGAFQGGAAFGQGGIGHR